MTEKRSQASQLVDMATADYVLGVSEDGQPYGSYPDTPHVALPLRGGKLGLRNALARAYFRKHDTVPSSQALADACNVIEAFAAQEPPRSLHLRVAAASDHIYIDMADINDRVIEIIDGSWRITAAAPVVFRRSELSTPIPEPTRGGNIDTLWQHVNIVEEDRPVLLAVLVAALIQPDAPHVILALLAEHGCAKTTTAKRLVALTDPSAAPVSGPPRDIDAWVHTAYGSWVCAVDNVSTVPQWWSDALCRAATGDAMTKRRLYTDADLAVLKFRRCVIVTGIDLGGLSGDLADRLALVELRRLTEDGRRDEAALDAKWEHDYPLILGALLDLAAQVHAKLADATVPRLPRMADFARVLALVDAILDARNESQTPDFSDLGGGKGLQRYRERSAHLSADSLASDSFIAELIARRYSCTDLTAREIRAQITLNDDGDKAGRRPSDWPKNARAITTRLTRHAPGLRAQGWRIEHDGGHNIRNVLRWTITPPEDASHPDSSNSSDSSPQASGRLFDEPLAGDESGDNSSASSNSSQTKALTCANEETSQTSQQSPPSLVVSGFTLPTGPDRCDECGFDVPTQGHRDGCSNHSDDGPPF